MKNAPNPYGQGDAAKKTVDSIEEYYDNGLLTITAPEDIMGSFTRKIDKISENISVKDFEEKENALIHMAYDGEKMLFPNDELNLNGMMVTYDKY